MRLPIESFALLPHHSFGSTRLERKKKTPRKIRKPNELEELLNEVCYLDLKNWIFKALSENKDLTLAFTSQFGSKQISYKPTDIVRMFNDSLKAVGCTRKKADISQLKKLVQLWPEMYQTVIDNYLSHPTNPAHIENVTVLIDEVMDFTDTINKNSVKTLRFVEDLWKQIENALTNIVDSSKWHEAIDVFINHLQDSNGNIRTTYLGLSFNLLALPDKTRSEYVLQKLLDHYKSLQKSNHFSIKLYTINLFYKLFEKNLLTENLDLFSPITFENDYNVQLISQLISQNKLEPAEKHCRHQIAMNYYEEYNIPYWDLLRKIYSLQKNQPKLMEVLMLLFPHTYDFNDFLFVSENMDATKFKAWRTKMLARARNSGKTSRKAISFAFQLSKHEQKYAKMIDYLDEQTPFEVIETYFTDMISVNKTLLLAKLIDINAWSFHGGDRTAGFPRLFELIKKHYSTEEIVSSLGVSIGKWRNVSNGAFKRFIEAELKLKN